MLYLVVFNEKQIFSLYYTQYACNRVFYCKHKKIVSLYQNVFHDLNRPDLISTF